MAVREAIKDSFYSMLAAVVFTIARMYSQRRGHSGDTVLVVALHKLGDTVLTIPAIDNILRFYPRNQVKLLVYNHSAGIYSRYFPFLAESNYIMARQDDFYIGALAKSEIRKKVQAYHPKKVIDISGGPHSATVLCTSGAEEISGMNLTRYRWTYTAFTPVVSTVPLWKMYLNACEASGVPLTVNEFEIGPTIDVRHPITVFPFAGWRAKEWSFDRYLELCRRLKEKYPVQILIEASQDNDALRVFSDALGIPLRVSGSIDELLVILENTSVLIAGDTGPVHVAAVLGKATFTVYGPTNPVFHMWKGKHHSFIRSGVDCLPESNEKYCKRGGGRTCPHINCMKQLSVSVVLEKVLELVSVLSIRRNEE